MNANTTIPLTSFNTIGQSIEQLEEAIKQQNWETLKTYVKQAFKQASNYEDATPVILIKVASQHILETNDKVHTLPTKKYFLMDIIALCDDLVACVSGKIPQNQKTDIVNGIIDLRLQPRTASHLD
jgi:hypothetical protein